MADRDNKLLTTFQNLGKYFDSTIHNAPKEITNNGGVELIKASSYEELQTKTLEYRQEASIFQQFSNIVQNNEYKALESQSLRVPAYLDYRMMEYYPIISQALNVLSEEATTIGENGKMLTVYSQNKAIKEELEYLFYDVLDVNSSLVFWCRNMCKYGDTFLFLLTSKDEGVKSARILPTIEIERKEKVDKDSKKIKTEFIWNEKGETYTQWQIAHFRLLTDDINLPYGTSVLSNVRVFWRLLRMSEDAMVVYRASRASERRVVKINVANIAPADVPQYVQQAASKFKRTQLVDPNTGQINYKFNPASIDQDIFIPVRSDNATNPIETLPGAQNLDQIGDISYLRDNLFTGLGIPKIFLGFSSDASTDGGGKNLAQLDVRFARKVNRIQQALIQELNKIALIHLLLVGYDESEIRNFSIKLANPSTQSDMLKLEHWIQKMDLYGKATTANDSGIRPMSETKAKREILGMSNDEIILDIKQQMVENVVGNEIKNATLEIKKSRLFNDLYDYYSAGIISKDNETPKGEEQQPEGETSDFGAETTISPESEETTLQERFITRNKVLNEELLKFLSDNDKKEE